jgi:hypothetical protein
MVESRQNEVKDNNFTGNGNYGVFIYEYTWSIIPALNHITHNNFDENVGGSDIQINSINFWRYNWWGKPYNIRIIFNSIGELPIIDFHPSNRRYEIPWGPC